MTKNSEDHVVPNQYNGGNGMDFGSPYNGAPGFMNSSIDGKENKPGFTTASELGEDLDGSEMEFDGQDNDDDDKHENIVDNKKIDPAKTAASDLSKMYANGYGGGLSQYDYIAPAEYLHDDPSILFALPEKNANGRTQWVTGAQYSAVYQRKHNAIPSVEHMDNARTLLRDDLGNLYPKATFARHAWLGPNVSKDEQWKLGNERAKNILYRSGLTENTFWGVVQKGTRNGKAVYELPLEERWVKTSTGPRRQQVEYKYPEQAGVANENILLVKFDGTIESFDIASDAEAANAPVDKLPALLGGTPHFKSEGNNGFQHQHYLDSLFGAGTAQKRYDSQLNKDTNTNDRLPKVGILLGGRLFDVRAVLENKDANPELAAAVTAGDRRIAHLFRVRSRTGGYNQVDYVAKTEGPAFDQLMQSHGINPQVGRHTYSDSERALHRTHTPDVLVDFGGHYLESGANVRKNMLKDGQSIASTYQANEIFVTMS